MGPSERFGIYDYSGTLIASEIVLPAPRADDHSGAPDVVVEWGESRPTAFERPSEDVVAELVVDGFPRYTFCRMDGGYVCRVMSVADFVIDADLRTVVCHPVPDGRRDVIPIIVTGTILAFLMAMKGSCVLHGSAVELGGRGLAFIGLSGQGKSTMAALFCASGGSLVTDDVLPLEFKEGSAGAGVYCRSFSHEVRLRDKAASLADRFGSDAGMRITADDRFALSPPKRGLDRVPLAAVLVPLPDSQSDRVGARRLEVGAASLWLARCQRIEGWRGREHLRRQFVDVGRVIATVPVIEVSVPWGPPFATDLPEQILDACGLVEEFAQPF